ncbi:MAG TPA: S8 family serine peptidase [Longimicrobiaceae bacterium]|nr:S8 family serine peptidase [Longimicrobiaceae bacterium]
MKNRSILSLALGAALLAGCSDEGPTALDAPAGPSLARGGQQAEAYLPGRLVVRFRPGSDHAGIANANGAAPERKMLLERTWVLKVPAGKEMTIAAALARNPNVEFAEPDYLYAVVPCEVGSCEGPADPFFGYKWDLHNDGAIRGANGALIDQTGQVDADIDWMEAHDYLGADFAGAAVIGIIDTGIRATHADLAGKVIAARNFATGYPATLIEDRNGHGTHVAGIAAAHGSNGLGVAGVAYGANVKLINAKSCDLYITGYDAGGQPIIGTSCPSSSTADAIVWATDNGADVLNLSLGGSPAATAGSAAQLAALRYARSKDVLPFCSTGNDNYPGISFPARFAECVAVGATGWSDTRASYSNYGAQIELSAPGGDSNPLGTPNGYILATTFTSDGSYGWKAGTSMATPQVAGLAALLYATGMTSADAVLARIKGSVDDLGPAGWDPEFGVGRINAYRAVAGVDPNAPPVASAGAAVSGSEGSPVSFDGSASRDPNGKALTYAWSFGDGSTGTGATPSHTYADNGVYTVTLTVTDPSGLSAVATTTATIANVAPTLTVAAARASLNQTFTLGSIFTDPGQDAWSCTINWGNDSVTRVENCTQSTTVSTVYRSAGTFRVRITVQEKDATTAGQFEVTVKNK